MDYQLEAIHEYLFAMWSSRSKSVRTFERGTQGEMFVLRELMFHGPCTPSSLAEAMNATSGRISSLLSGMYAKGWIERENDPRDRRSVLVDLTDEGREVAKKQGEELVADLRWVFSQMGEGRTREFVKLFSDFMVYMSICQPEGPQPTQEQVTQAFERRDRLHERMVKLSKKIAEDGLFAEQVHRRPPHAPQRE